MSSLTSAMNTSVNALALNETAISVIGNNIANADTDGFKASTALFHDAVVTDDFGRLGSHQHERRHQSAADRLGGQPCRDRVRLHPRAASPTPNIPSDLAIQGNGFFILGHVERRRLYAATAASRSMRTMSSSTPRGRRPGLRRRQQLQPDHFATHEPVDPVRQSERRPADDQSFDQRRLIADRHGRHTGCSTFERHAGRCGKCRRRCHVLDAVDES